MDGIRSKYGSNAILRAVSYTPAGTAIHRAGLTGDINHNKGADFLQNKVV